MATALSDAENFERLQIVRESMHLPRRVVAAKMGVDPSALYNWCVHHLRTAAWPVPDEALDDAEQRLRPDRTRGAAPLLVHREEQRVQDRCDAITSRHQAREAMWLAREKPGLNGRKAKPLSQQAL